MGFTNNDELKFVVSVAGRTFACRYWPGPYNIERLQVATVVLPGDSWSTVQGNGTLGQLKAGESARCSVSFDLGDWIASPFSHSDNSPFTVEAQSQPLFYRDSRNFWRLLPEISQALVEELRRQLWLSPSWPAALTGELAAARLGVLSRESVAGAMYAAASAAESAGFDANDMAAEVAALSSRLEIEKLPRGAAPSKAQLLGKVVTGKPLQSAAEETFDLQVFTEPIEVGGVFFPRARAPYHCTRAGKVQQWSPDLIADLDEFGRKPGKYQTVTGVPLSLELVEYEG